MKLFAKNRRRNVAEPSQASVQIRLSIFHFLSREVVAIPLRTTSVGEVVGFGFRRNTPANRQNISAKFHVTASQAGMALRAVRTFLSETESIAPRRCIPA